MNELEAVNRILKGSGLAPVNTLDTPNVPEEALRAQAILEEATEDILTQDWKFNTILDLEYEPDDDGEVTIPGYAYVEFDDIHQYELAPVLIGDRVFSRKKNTYVLNEAIKIRRAVRSIAWEDLPPAVQLYIIKLAQNTFVSTVLGDTSSIRHTQESLMRAYTELNRYRVKENNRAFISMPSVLNRSGYPVGNRVSRLSGGEW